jgi:hypothetical protein
VRGRADFLGAASEALSLFGLRLQKSPGQAWGLWGTEPTGPQVTAPARTEEDPAEAVVPLEGDPKRRKPTEQVPRRFRMASRDSGMPAGALGYGIKWPLRCTVVLHACAVPPNFPDAKMLGAQKLGSVLSPKLLS